MFKKTIITVIAISMFIGAVAANADEVDNAPGSMCISTSGTLAINTAGHARNTSSSTRTAICPSERKIVNGNFTTKFKGTIWVMDRSSSANICCRAKSRNPGGADVQSAEVCSSGSSSSYQELNTAEITDTYTWSHFYISCTIPPVNGSSDSRILTFRSTQR